MTSRSPARSTSTSRLRVRFGRSRFTDPPAGPASGSEDANASTADLLSLLQAIEAAAGRVYGRHGLPQQPGHYRRPADSDAWERLEDALTPAEKWALVSAPDSVHWRYSTYEALGSAADAPDVRHASALLAACQGLRQRLSERSAISVQDLADSIRLGEAWRRLVEEAGPIAASPTALRFSPPDEPS